MPFNIFGCFSIDFVLLLTLLTAWNNFQCLDLFCFQCWMTMLTQLQRRGPRHVKLYALQNMLGYMDHWHHVFKLPSRQLASRQKCLQLVPTPCPVCTRGSTSRAASNNKCHSLTNSPPWSCCAARRPPTWSERHSDTCTCPLGPPDASAPDTSCRKVHSMWYMRLVACINKPPIAHTWHRIWIPSMTTFSTNTQHKSSFPIDMNAYVINLFQPHKK